MENKKLSTIIVGLAIGMGLYLIYKKSLAKKANGGLVSADNLPDELKSAYNFLSAKGYSPKLNSGADKKMSVTFDVNDTESNINVLIKDDNSIVITENKSEYPPIYFNSGLFTQNQYIIAEDSNMVSGILQIIQNEDFKP